MINAFKTTVLLAALGGIVIAAGAMFGGSIGLVVGLLVAFLFTGCTYWFSHKLAILAAKAKPASPASYPEYHEIMAELSQKAGVPVPQLFIAPDPQPNAFATGRNPRNAAVCVTVGLIDAMGWDEIRGVLAHELAHIRNRDILLCSVAAAIGMTITFVAYAVTWGALLFGDGDRDRGGNLFGQFLFALLSPIAAALIQAAVSRSREFQADASAAKMIGTGEPLARALERIDAHARRIPSKVNPSQASAYIVNPLKAQAGGAAARLFSTHPLTAERVRRLRSTDWS